MREHVKFHGGYIGAWLPILFMLAGMFVNTFLKGGFSRLLMITFAAIALGFFLSKDKKHFGDITITGLQNSLLSTIIVAYILASLLAQLLRQSGLIDTLIYSISVIGLHAGLVPLIAFFICVLISTSCGTSTGSIAAVAPVFLPLAAGLNIDMGLMCGAIISGAIFGDNLAPISDTTISSAVTQEAEISDVVRTRFPYAAISAIISAVLFVIVGLQITSSMPPEITVKSVTIPSLILLLLPLMMVLMMRKGWDLMSTLIVCNISGIILDWGLGCIPAETLFGAKGPIASGLTGMLPLVLYVMMLFMIIQMLKCSGAFEQLAKGMMKFCTSFLSGELVCYACSVLGSIMTGGSGIAIIFFGPFVRTITKTMGIDRCRGANILDGVACGTTGLMPHGNPMLISVGLAIAIPGVDPNFSFLSIVPYAFHCWGLILIFLLSILSGIGRKLVTPEPLEENS